MNIVSLNKKNNETLSLVVAAKPSLQGFATTKDLMVSPEYDGYAFCSLLKCENLFNVGSDNSSKQSQIGFNSLVHALIGSAVFDINISLIS